MEDVRSLDPLALGTDDHSVRVDRAGRPVGRALYLEERTIDWSTGTVDTYRVIISPEGEQIERPYVLRIYAVKEWIEMLREAGFDDAEALSLIHI